ncbi:MAG: LLM class flavin-dependent oxidoreductase [Dehalococcoidia bacterium]|nr:LLM class flavin-dependent oxidoreductase [Dehalococcoidia bacterium]
MVKTELGVPLSVLDVAPVSEGYTPRDALRNSLDLAQRVERLGFSRYWVAEHHNMPGIASSAPAVLIAHLASVTAAIRVGSGGVMLPNHSSLVVAEQFGMLEALHPGRVDLGIGRAPGTDQLTAHALRRSYTNADDFPEQLVELLGYFEGRWPPDHPFRAITANPGLGYRPEIWMLGSSDYGARAAGLLGLPYSFAHHFAGTNTMEAVRTYREGFREGGAIQKPYLMLGVSVVCAATDEQAEWLAAPGALSFVRLRSGRPGRFPTPDEAAAHEYSPQEQVLLKARTSSQIVGGPERVRAGLRELIESTRADELMLTTAVHAHTDRVRSYELIAEAVGMQPAPGRPALQG